MPWIAPHRILLSIFCIWLAASTAVVAEDSLSQIQQENAHEGARDWQLTRVKVAEGGCRSARIEGYCSKQSVTAGESIDIMISTNPARAFRVEFFRTGYYGGRGARLMKIIDRVEGMTQQDPTPGEKDLHECLWKASLSLTIPQDWLSGVYLGRLTTIPDDNEPYWQSYVIFIVRDDRPADVLFQCSDNTWQAYNVWPSHYSVYTHPKGGQGPWADVSFDRPYGRESQYTSVVNDPLTVGAGEFIPYEFPMTYWLEQSGYDVSYVSNSDMLTADRGLKCKAFISIGHDEYWDRRQFDSVTKMRDEGVNLLFLSGNSVCWVTPLRASTDGTANRIFFRGGPYGAENDYAVGREKDNGPFPFRGPDEGLLMGARNVEPVNGGGDWTATKTDHWMFESTEMKNGESIPGLIGWEYHGQPADIPGLEVVAGGTAWQGGVNPQQWTATIYPGPKNNFVFNAATIWWAQALGDPPGHTLPWSHHSRPHGSDDRVQQITNNLLKRAIGK
ncbi:MAG: N,N-dimethylformamidase beta subunit family domain-containing protein [Planctomycetaceae bacterium]